MSRYGVIFGSYFPAFSPNTGKYGPQIPPYLDTFHIVSISEDDFFLKNGPIHFHINNTSVIRLINQNQLRFTSIEVSKKLPAQSRRSDSSSEPILVVVTDQMPDYTKSRE